VGQPGGDAALAHDDHAVGVASQFLTSGLVYIQRNADDERTEYPVTPNGVATNLPLVGDYAARIEAVYPRRGESREVNSMRVRAVPTPAARS